MTSFKDLFTSKTEFHTKGFRKLRQFLHPQSLTLPEITNKSEEIRLKVSKAKALMILNESTTEAARILSIYNEIGTKYNPNYSSKFNELMDTLLIFTHHATGLASQALKNDYSEGATDEINACSRALDTCIYNLFTDTHFNPRGYIPRGLRL